MSRLKRRRDDQQWILDYLVKTTGRDRNFGVDHHLWPPNVARNHRMVPRVMSRIGKQREALARVSHERGHATTAIAVYHDAAKAYRTAQHAIMEDLPQKKALYECINRCFDAVIELSPTPIERAEIEWEGVSLPGLFYHAGDGRARPTALFIPGMDATKEDVPNPVANIFLQRGLNVLVIDGPGQGEALVRGIKVTDDNYERAASAAVDWLVARPEVDAERIGAIGFSMGSFWAPRAAAFDHRIKALVAAMGCYLDKRYIFDMDSPHFKQMFMYMAGIEDEDEFDLMAEKMTLRGYGERIVCPTLLCSGEFDPLCPLEDAYELYDELGGPKELWVVADEAHRLHWVDSLAGMSVWLWCLDWLRDALEGRYSPDHGREVYIEKGGAGPFDPAASEPSFRSWDNGVSVVP